MSQMDMVLVLVLGAIACNSQLSGFGLWKVFARMSVVLAAAFICTTPIVHDGDTIRCGSERIRIENIDAPELPDSPKCHDRRVSYAWCDYKAGYASRDALAGFLQKGPVKVERHGTDRYGRTLATVSVNGQDAGAYLIGLGLAKVWR